MNLVVGVIFKATFPIFTGNYPNVRYSHDVQVKAQITKESYGEKTGQHTFTFSVLESDDNAEFEVGKSYRKKGRNLYPQISEHFLPEDYAIKAAEKAARSERKKNELALKNL